jgi:hypothetical protein
MATEAQGGETQVSGPEGQRVAIRLVPNAQSEQPILSNVSLAYPAQALLFVDFGFIQPSAMQALAGLARSGKKAPQQLDARLSARVALTYDAAAGLHQQLGKALEAARKGQAAKP